MGGGFQQSQRIAPGSGGERQSIVRRAAVFRGLRRRRPGRAAALAALPLPTRQASMEGGCLKKGFASCSRRNFPEAALCRGGLPSGEILIPGKGAIPPGRDPSIFLFHLCRRGRGFPLCFDQQDSFRKGFGARRTSVFYNLFSYPYKNILYAVFRKSQQKVGKYFCYNATFLVSFSLFSFFSKLSVIE